MKDNQNGRAEQQLSVGCGDRSARWVASRARALQRGMEILGASVSRMQRYSTMPVGGSTSKAACSARSGRLRRLATSMRYRPRKRARICCIVRKSTVLCVPAVIARTARLRSALRLPFTGCPTMSGDEEAERVGCRTVVKKKLLDSLAVDLHAGMFGAREGGVC